MDTAKTISAFTPQTPRVVVRAAFWKAVQLAASLDQRLRLFLLPYAVRDVMVLGGATLRDAVVVEALSVSVVVVTYEVQAPYLRLVWCGVVGIMD